MTENKMSEEKNQIINLNDLIQDIKKFVEDAAENPPWESPTSKAADIPISIVSETERIVSSIKDELQKTAKKLNVEYRERLESIKSYTKERQNRMESYAIRERRTIPAVKDKFIIAGRVCDRFTGVGLPNLKVKSSHPEKKNSKKTFTDTLGYFRIEYSKSDTDKLNEQKTGIQIEIFCENDKTVYTTILSADDIKTENTKFITASIDGDKAPESISLAKDISISLSNRVESLRAHAKLIEHLKR